MLDTNTVSHLLKQHLMVARRVEAAPMASLCVSAITAGELLFGLAKRPDAKRLGRVVTELLRRVDAGTVRAAMKPRGRVLVQMLSITGNIERAGFSEKIQPQINAKADANRSGTVDNGESISTHLR